MSESIVVSAIGGIMFCIMFGCVLVTMVTILSKGLYLTYHRLIGKWTGSARSKRIIQEVELEIHAQRMKELYRWSPIEWAKEMERLKTIESNAKYIQMLRTMEKRVLEEELKD